MTHFSEEKVERLKQNERISIFMAGWKQMYLQRTQRSWVVGMGRLYPLCPMSFSKIPGIERHSIHI
jgi:hypothetical protein